MFLFSCAFCAHLEDFFKEFTKLLKQWHKEKPKHVTDFKVLKQSFNNERQLLYTILIRCN